MTPKEALKSIIEDGINLGAGDYVELETLKVAAKALEKQIPKKPMEHDRLVCPNCNSKAKYGHPYEHYCCHCGQAIDWGNEE